MATADVLVNGNQNDWSDRYYHVDQVLDKPGPRTDPSFLAGEEVCPSARLEDVSVLMQ